MGSSDDLRSAAAASRIGSVLRNKWRLDTLLGVGGMAAVYAATHRNGACAAIKMLHPQLSLEHTIRRRFLREGYVANLIGHRGAVAVLDDDVSEDGAMFLVMELLEGETLDARRVRYGGRIVPEEVLCIVDQVHGVLAAAHPKGIVHRDLKPENIFVNTNGDVKVLDFGLQQDLLTSVATRSGAPMGTPAYMAPEQARGRWEEVDGRTDLWSVGATMINLLSGRMVHEARTISEVLLLAMTEPPPSLTYFMPSAPAALVVLVDRALEFDRSRRWESAEEMREVAREAFHILRGEPISTTPHLTVLRGAQTQDSSVPIQAAMVSEASCVPPDRNRSRTGHSALRFAFPAIATMSVTIGILAEVRLTPRDSMSSSDTGVTSTADLPIALSSISSGSSGAVPSDSTPQASRPTTADTGVQPSVVRTGATTRITVTAGPNSVSNPDLLERRK